MLTLREIQHSLRAGLSRPGADGVILRALDEATAENPSGAFNFEFGRPYYTGALQGLTGTGADLLEFTYEQRLEMWQRAHQAWRRNPWAKGALKHIRNFAVGEGHSMTYRAQRVREVLEGFRSDPENRIEQYDKAFCTQLLLDGELFIRYTETDVRDRSGTPATGALKIDPIPPWWVQDITFDPDFRARVVDYEVYFRRGPSLRQAETAFSIERVPARRILHVPINNLGYEVRGYSELLAILPWLKAYKDWLEDRARINRYRGALLYDVAIEGTAADISSKRSQYRTPPPPGSVVIHSTREKWNTVDSRINADQAGEDGRQIRLAAAVGVNLPEYFLGDGANANRATSKSQELPALRSFLDYQDLLRNLVWRPIYRRRLDLALAAGEIEGTGPQRRLLPEVDADGDPVLDARTSRPQLVDVFDAFDLAFPPVLEGDPKNLSEALSLQAAQGWVDDDTAMVELGYDPQVIRKRLAAQAQAQAARTSQGLAIDTGDDDELDTMVDPEVAEALRRRQEAMRTRDGNGRSGTD